ncbi:MAG: thioredoxin family protein [Zetaproteobacteria bacterium CG1_02_53_45]|nr:MAG: thioredoxin family protein [Zetaproteobacteria bacterium CG1_02_53_45]
MSVPHIQLMSRSICCLCDDAKAVVAALADAGLCTWETVDVDRDKALMVRFGMDVPVLVNANRVLFKHCVTATELKSVLAELSPQGAMEV